MARFKRATHWLFARGATQWVLRLKRRMTVLEMFVRQVKRGHFEDINWQKDPTLGPANCESRRHRVSVNSQRP
jgi:hypothetical protein